MLRIDIELRRGTFHRHVRIDDEAAEGVLVAHGDATCGYSLYLQDGRLVEASLV